MAVSIGCLMLAMGCFFLLGGCAVQQAVENSSPAFVAPQGSSKTLSSQELAGLYSTGQIDRDVPREAMEDVKQQYTYFLRQGRGSMKVFSKRAERYLKYSRRVFRERGMPEELAYLAIVESGYRADAKSPAGAAGAWQFMPFTGEKFALSQDWWTDERLDPYEATEAAASYLQKLYATFEDWPTAIAAYNAGEGKMGRAMQGTGSRNFYETKARNNMLDEKARLREETKQYVPRFLAVSKIMRNLPQLGFEAIRPDEAQGVVRLNAKPGTDLQGLAHACRMDWAHFNNLNKHHKRLITHTNRQTYVYVPAGRDREAREFLASPDSTLFAHWGPCTIGSSAESWDKISRRCHVPVAQLQALNPQVDRLHAGDVLLLPGIANVAGSVPGIQAQHLVGQGGGRSQTVAHAGVRRVTHTVQVKETLMSISRRYHVSLSELQRENGIHDPNVLQPGMTLRIPAGANAVASGRPSNAAHPVVHGVVGHAAPSRAGKLAESRPRQMYTVQAHDNLWRIARAYNVSVEDLKRWNGVDENNLRVGTRLLEQQ